MSGLSSAFGFCGFAFFCLSFRGICVVCLFFLPLMGKLADLLPPAAAAASVLLKAAG